MLFPFSLELFPFPFPFPLVAQNYFHSHVNPMGFPCTPLACSGRLPRRSLFSERYKLALTAFAARRIDISERRRVGLRFWMVSMSDRRPDFQKWWNAKWDHSAYCVKVSARSRLCPWRRNKCKFRWTSKRRSKKKEREKKV